MGKLVIMPAPLDDQGFIEQKNRLTDGNPQPEVIILTGRQLFIKKTHPGQKFPFDHYRRRADDAQGKTMGKDVTGILAVLLPRIDPPAPADPDFLSLADHRLGMGGKKIQLPLDFLRPPEIVGIQQGHKLSTALTNAPVAGRTHSPVFFVDNQNKPLAIGTQPLPGIVGGTVINHDDFQLRTGLGQNRLHRFNHH